MRKQGLVLVALVIALDSISLPLVPAYYGLLKPRAVNIKI